MYDTNDRRVAVVRCASYEPDAIEPATKDAHTVMRYSENNLSAGVAYQGDYKTFVLGFPFESIRTDSEREALMNAVLTFFNDNK